MMNRALQLLSYEVRGLHTAVYVIALSSLLSSLLALLRDRLLAHSFGASATLDIYYAAFRIPDLIFVGAGALVGRTRLMLLQPIFLGLSNIFGAITQVRQRYALCALSPLLYNVGIISGVVVFYPQWGLTGLAFGVVLGALLHVGIQLPSVFADGFIHALPRAFKPRVFLETVKISIPRALALSMNQVSFIGLVALAGTLVPGSIAVYMFASNLQAVPLAVIGASYSVAAFPILAAALSRGDKAYFIEHIANAA